MIKIIGSKCCSRCKNIKNILTAKGINFKYINMEELNENEESRIKKFMEENSLMQLPLIIKDTKAVELQEVLK